MAKSKKVSPGSLGKVTTGICFIFSGMIAAGVTPLVAFLAPAVVFTVIAALLHA